MKDNITTEETLLQARQKAKHWWRWFWATIVFLCLLYFLAIYFQNYQTTNYDLNTPKGRENYSHKMINALTQISPDMLKYISTLSELSKENIKSKIHQEISSAYAPIYNEGIKNFSKFHYTLQGEYLELYSASSDGVREYFNMQTKEDFNTLIYEMLFQSTNFEKHLKSAYSSVNTFAINEMVKNRNKLHVKMKNDLNTTDEQTLFLVNKLLKIGTQDMKSRFEKEVSIGIHAGGLGSGTIIGALASKQIAKMFTKKMLAKATIKSSSKLAGATAGATLGGVEGLVCGPGAPLCSTAGAIIGGIVGWFATDKIVIEADQYFNSSDFEKGLRRVIEEQQKQTEKQLYSIYTKSINTINAQDKKKLEVFKNTQNKEHFLK